MRKFGIIKYIIFAIFIIALCGYLFNKVSPKTAQAAKEEFFENVFGFVVKTEQDTIKNDSIVSSVPIPIVIEDKKTSNDSSIIAVPIDITNNLVFVIGKVNGVKMRFLLDTGCSTIQITSAEYYYMRHLGVISEDKIKDEVDCTYANGSNEKCLTLLIDSFDIGGIKLNNINGVIQENCNTDLLLGQEILKELGEVSIDYTNKQLKIKRK